MLRLLRFTTNVPVGDIWLPNLESYVAKLEESPEKMGTFACHLLVREGTKATLEEIADQTVSTLQKRLEPFNERIQVTPSRLVHVSPVAADLWMQVSIPPEDEDAAPADAGAPPPSGT
ncbi:MAG: hypothetical protein WCV86_01950 [Patescibacteria group bacterium]|jgi:hypothetical protein